MRSKLHIKLISNPYIKKRYIRLMLQHKYTATKKCFFNAHDIWIFNTLIFSSVTKTSQNRCMFYRVKEFVRLSSGVKYSWGLVSIGRGRHKMQAWLKTRVLLSGEVWYQAQTVAPCNNKSAGISSQFTLWRFLSCCTLDLEVINQCCFTLQTVIIIVYNINITQFSIGGYFLSCN